MSECIQNEKNMIQPSLVLNLSLIPERFYQNSFHRFLQVSLVLAQMVRSLPTMQETKETWVRSLGREGPLDAWQPTPVILPGEPPCTEEPGGLQSTGSQLRHWHFVLWWQARALTLGRALSSQVWLCCVYWLGSGVSYGIALCQPSSWVLWAEGCWAGCPRQSRGRRLAGCPVQGTLRRR